jgi:Arc/MetJ family transcription regulator
MDKIIEIKDDLVKEAMEITGAASEREAVERAVESYVAQHRRRRPRKNMCDLVGDVRLRDDYDYKALRADDASLGVF